jgi:hypothetical protein
MRIFVGKNGTAQSVSVISRHSLLLQSAMDAVKQWRYAPTLGNGNLWKWT